MALESRKLTDMLEKERSGRKADKRELETLQSSTTQTNRRISQHQTQYSELEKQRHKEAKSLKQLEDQYREQLAERNSLLTQAWQRLSAVCGADWIQRNSTVQTSNSSGVNGGRISMDAALISAFPGFTNNLVIALKTIESIVAGFKTRCRNVERDLWKEYQAVEQQLESRTRRLDRLESLVRGGIGDTSQAKTDVAKLRAENRSLKTQIIRLKSDTATSSSGVGTNADGASSIAPTSTTSFTQHSLRRTQTAHTSSAQTAVARSDSAKSEKSGEGGGGGGGGGEKRWILRLRELEKRLKQEREARLLDRDMANRKILESKGQKDEIRKELEREKVRAEK
jgi:cell division protein FtsB